MSSPAVVLEARGLSAGYGGREIVSGVSFTLHDGDVLAVVGPNGSGKTTLLKTILGMMRPIAGSVRLLGPGGIGPGGLEPAVAYIPQRIEIDRTFPISLREMLALSSTNSDCEKYLDFLELRGLLDMRVGDLSGGQLQRAFMAYAIAKEPRLLVMDEPTSWVDARGADCVICIMEEFRKKGMAMVVVTHDFSSMQNVATHVLGLSTAIEGGYFFGPADSPEMAGQAAALFGLSHHGGGHVHCALRLDGQKEGGLKGGGSNADA